MADEKIVDEIEFEDEKPEVDQNALDAQELMTDLTDFLDKKIEMKPDIEDRLFLPTGLDLLDAILGGGFPFGAFSMITGNPGSGKTMLACKALGAGQRHFLGKLMAAFLDAEESMTKHRLSMLGVKNPMIDPYNNLTVEKVFRFVKGVSLFKLAKEIDVPSAIVWDSIANTLSEKEHETDDINSVIGYKARLLSAMLPRALTECAKQNIALIAINQLRDKLKLGQFAPANDLKFISQEKNIPGGNAIKFNAFHLIEMKVKTTVKPEKYGFEGIVSKLKAIKNKQFAPNIEIEIMGSFTHGFSNFWTNYRFLRDNKRIESGAWNKLLDLPEKKFRTKEANQKYKTDPEFKEAFDNAVKETLQTEIIDKYTVKDE